MGALALIVIALLGARLSFSTERAPVGPRLLFRTGTHFLPLGFLIGPAGLGVLTTEATAQLSPFLALGLGWVGFHFGLQLDLRSLRSFAPTHHAVAFGQAALSLLLFAGVGLLAIRAAELEGPVPVLLVCAAASVGSSSSARW